MVLRTTTKDEKGGDFRAVSTKRDSYLSALFRRLAARRGNKRATMAVGHAILVIAFHLLKRKENYRERGAHYFDQKNADSLRRSLVKRLNGSVIPLPSL